MPWPNREDGRPIEVLRESGLRFGYFDTRRAMRLDWYSTSLALIGGSLLGFLIAYLNQ